MDLRLGIAEGDPVTATRYFIRMGDPPQPVTISTSWEPLALTSGTDIELPHEGPLANQGIVPRFDHIGYHVNEVEEILHIRNATAEEARKLELPASRNVVEITQTFRVAQTDVDNDITVQTADILFAADRYELRYVMKID
ncbi:MAG: UTRA domain-containing protein [Pseudonocardiaceae bacterium]